MATERPPRSPIRVLHVYAGNLYGGVEKILQTLATERMRCPEMESSFALCFEGRIEKELRAAGSPVYLLNPVRFSRPWTILTARRALAKVLRNSPGFDVVVTHSGWLHALFAPVVRQAPKKPALVFWLHDIWTHPNRIDRVAGRTPPDLLLANSRYTITTAPLVFPNVRGEVIYCPVLAPPTMDRIAIRAEVRKSLNCAADKQVIFMAARLERWKGHTLLLDALGKLEPAMSWEAWIGGGPQRLHEEQYLAELKAQAVRFNIHDRVKFIGQRTDIPRLLCAADIHCQPNTGPEPFGIAFIEALQAGLPVVTTRLGALPEIVDEHCGVLVPPDDAAALAKALTILLDDIPRRQRLGTAGPARAAQLCDAGTQLNKLKAILETTVN